MRELIRGSFDVVERGVEATGSVLSSLAGNPNPLSQGIIIGGGIVALLWLNTWHPSVARALGLDKLVFPGHKGYDLDNSGVFCVRYKPLLAGEITQCFDSDTERAAFLDDQPGVRALNPILFQKEQPFPGGQFCIFLRGSADQRTQCYENMQLRDEAFDIILRSSPFLQPEKIDR